MVVLVVVVVVVVVAVVVAVYTLRRCGDTPAMSGAISQGVASSQRPGVANLKTEILDRSPHSFILMIATKTCLIYFIVLQSFLCWQLRPRFRYKNILFKWQQWMELNWRGAPHQTYLSTL